MSRRRRKKRSRTSPFRNRADPHGARAKAVDSSAASATSGLRAANDRGARLVRREVRESLASLAAARATSRDSTSRSDARLACVPAISWARSPMRPGSTRATSARSRSPTASLSSRFLTMLRTGSSEPSAARRFAASASWRAATERPRSEKGNSYVAPEFMASVCESPRRGRARRAARSADTPATAASVGAMSATSAGLVYLPAVNHGP